MAMKMAVVSMEMTPGAIPRPSGVLEQRLLSPETEFRDGGGAPGVFLEFFNSSLVFRSKGLK